jgi:predicted DNA-binding transcriptional regulator AlpA
MLYNVPINDEALLRLPEILRLIPVGKSTWWAGVKSGRYPKPIKLGPGITVWRIADIRQLLENGTD